MTDASKQILSVLTLVAVTIVWGYTFIIVKWTVAEMDVCYFLFLRFLIAALLLAAVFRKHIKKIDLKTVIASLILAVFLSSGYFMQTEGLRFTSATNSSMITGLYLVMVPVLSALFFKTKAGTGSIIGVVISVAGLYILTNYSFDGINYGDYLTLFCAFAYTWHIILTGRFTLKHDVIPLVLYQFIFVTIFLGVATFLKGGYTFNIQPIAWFTIFVTAVPATAVAFIAQAVAQRYIDPTRVGIIFALESVFGALFGWWIGHEVLTALALIGACLMVAGMMVSEAHPIARYIRNKIVG